MATRTLCVSIACCVDPPWIASNANAHNHEKVDICHSPPGVTGKAIRISVGAMAAVTHISKHADVLVPEDDSCAVGLGECAAVGILTCTSDGLLCDANPYAQPEAVEVSCTDGLDNDCDGLADNFDDDCGCTPGPATEVAFNGICYYLDGSNGVCDAGYTLAPQSVLSSIASGFVGKTYRHVRSNNCCIKHANQAVEGQDWGMVSADCNRSGSFSTGPALGAVGCTNANLNNSNQLSHCGSQ